MEHTMHHEDMNHGSMNRGSVGHDSTHQVASSMSNACGDMNMHGHGMSVRMIRISNNQCC